MALRTNPANRAVSLTRRMVAFLLSTALVLALPAPKVCGAVTSYGFDGFVQYTQTANNTPGTGSTAFFQTSLNYSNSADVTAATGTSGAVATGQAAFTYAPSGTSASYQSGYITPTQLSDYMEQGTNFTANITSGDLAGQTSSVTYGPTLFPSASYLTGNTYNSLLGLDTTQAFTLTFNGFTPNAGGSSSAISLAIYNPSNDAIAYDEAFSPATTSALLPAGTLAPGTTYALLLDYSNSLSTANAGFGSATFTDDYDARDFLSFTTSAVVPEPASVMTIGVVSTLLLARRRRARGSEA